MSSRPTPSLVSLPQGYNGSKSIPLSQYSNGDILVVSLYSSSIPSGIIYSGGVAQISRTPNYTFSGENWVCCTALVQVTDKNTPMSANYGIGYVIMAKVE